MILNKAVKTLFWSNRISSNYNTYSRNNATIILADVINIYNQTALTNSPTNYANSFECYV